jgi:hypothetical protein
MTEVRSAAYIRKGSSRHTRNTEPPGVTTVLEQELWELLRTPHTVQSLSRAITAAARSTTDDADATIKIALGQWIEADLIELSPDS